MQIAKIIIGAIIGLIGLFTMIQIAGEESGAGLAGAFIGVLLLGILAGWLIYSGIKETKKNK
jgi:flagellar motor component MotA